MTLAGQAFNCHSDFRPARQNKKMRKAKTLLWQKPASRWMNDSSPIVLQREEGAVSSPTANKNGFQELNRKARRGMSQEPQVQRARSLMFLRGNYMIYTRSEGSQGLSHDPNSDVFGSLIFWHSLECFILSEESLGVCLDVPKLLSAQLTMCPAIPLFLLPSGLSGTSVSQDPQSQLAVNKAGVAPIYLTLGKHGATKYGGSL